MGDYGGYNDNKGYSGGYSSGKYSNNSRYANTGYSNGGYSNGVSYGGYQDNNNGYGRSGGRRFQNQGQRKFKAPRSNLLKQKTPEQRERERITKYLFKLGESQIKEDYESAANSFINDLQYNSILAHDIFVTCIKEAPHRIPAYGTLIGLINLRDVAFAGTIIQKVYEAFTNSIENYEWRSAKFLLHFIVELSNTKVVRSSSVLEYYKTIVTTISNEFSSRFILQRLDALTWIIFSTIPYSTELLRELPDDVDSILSNLEPYLSARKSHEKYKDVIAAKNVLSLYKGQWPFVTYEPLDLIYEQIKDFKSSGWSSDILNKPNLLFSSSFETQISQDLPVLSIPSGNPLLPPPSFDYQPVFRIFDDSIINTEGYEPVKLPSTTSISRFYIDDLAQNIIDIYSINHTEASQILNQLDDYFSKNILADSGYKINAAIIESIFAKMFKLPVSSEKVPYYGSLIIDLIRLKPQEVPKSLGRAIKILYSRLETKPDSNGNFTLSDSELVSRFSTWFSFHLSNFKYSWKWSDWEEELLELDEDNLKVAFVRDTLSHTLRLSYYDRIKDTIPPTFAAIGPKLFASSGLSVVYKFDPSGPNVDNIPAPVIQAADQIRNMILSKASDDEIHARIAELETMEGILYPGVNNFRELSVDLVFQTILAVGSKSFSHILNAFERYVKLLRDMAADAFDRNLAITSIVQFSTGNTQLLEIFIDKLLIYRVLDTKSVIEWVLKGSLKDKGYSYESRWVILASSLSKVNLKLTSITRKLEKAKKEKSAAKSIPKDGDTLVDESTESNIDADAMQTGNDEVEHLQNMLSNVETEKNETFIYVIKQFVEFLQSLNQETQKDVFEWVLREFIRLLRQFSSEIKPVKVSIDLTIFNSVQPGPIKEVWESIKAMYNL